MTTPARHPDDATLFDFATGELAADVRADVRADVERHVAHCSACAAFIAASERGADALAHAVTPLSPEAAERLDARVASEWHLLHTGEPVAVDTAPRKPARSTTRNARDRRPRARSWRRRAVPVLAFVVLAALAGVSVTLVDDPGTTSRPDTSSDGAQATNESSESQATPDRSTAAPAADDGGGASVEQDPAAPADGVAGASPAQPSAGEPALSDIGVEGQGQELDPNAKATGEPNAVTGVPSPEDQYAGSDGTASPGVTNQPYESVCVAGRDASQVVLPDYRYPTTVIEAPLGLVIVCG